jgi:hypothetical protein
MTHLQNEESQGMPEPPEARRKAWKILLPIFQKESAMMIS